MTPGSNAMESTTAFPDSSRFYLARSDTEDLWIGGYWADGYSELCRWRPGSHPLDVRRGDKHPEGVSSLKAVSDGQAGSLWVAIEDPHLPLRLDHLQGGVWTSHTFPGYPHQLTRM